MSTRLVCAAAVVAVLSSLRDLPNATAEHEPSATVNSSTVLPATPGLRGFGTYTPAGSGRHLIPPRALLYRVTSLADAGPGTLRDCVQRRQARTCVFEIGGTIKLRDRLRIRSPFITIAGQTAPPPGITLTQGGIAVETHDVLIQHLAIRPGDNPHGVSPADRDGVSVGSTRAPGAYNVVLDHLSVSWAIDENVSTWYPDTHDVTISNCLIAEGLHRSIHPKGPHSKGVMIGDGSSRITLYRNLITWNEERNPYIKPGASAEVINNIVHGWGSKGPWSLCNISNNDLSSERIELSFIGNTYIPGPSSFIAEPLFGKHIAPGSLVFIRDSQLQDSALDSKTSRRATHFSMRDYETSSPPLQSPGLSPVLASDAFESVLEDVGSRPRHRSRIDQRLVRQVRERSGEIKDCIVGCGHAVGYQREARVTRRKLRLPRAPFADRDRDGYTNLENWLQRLARNS